MVTWSVVSSRTTALPQQGSKTSKRRKEKGEREMRGGEDGDARWSLRARSLEIIIITMVWIINVDVYSIGA